MRHFNRLLTFCVVSCALPLASCGLAETTAVTATQATAAAEQAKQGQALQADVKAKLEEAQRTAQQQLEQAEAQANGQ